MPIYKVKKESFFRHWSPEMAYVLGFFAADGSMIRNKRGAHFIEFTSTDRELLESIRRLLKSNHKISARERGQKWQTAYRLQIGSKVMFDDLLQLGLTPRKSKTITFPEIPSPYLSHFVRGYFDGDGNVTSSVYKRANRPGPGRTLLSGFTSGSRRFLKLLLFQLRRVYGLKGGTLYYSSRGHRLYFSVRDSYRLYNVMYKNAGDLFLSRKRVVFEKYFGIA